MYWQLPETFLLDLIMNIENSNNTLTVAATQGIRYKEIFVFSYEIFVRAYVRTAKKTVTVNVIKAKMQTWAVRQT